MEKAKEFWGGLSKQVKMMIFGGGAAIIIGALIIGIIINNNRTYEVLFNGVSSSEAQQIIGKLQEEQTPYQYKGSDILVPADVLDITKAKLVSEGYPQSGFTYDVFRNNVGMMTTESDRERFGLYDLETRIGATIQLFEGVREAYVTIALGDVSRYALDDETREASAQAVVVMADGGSPSPEVAKSVQHLISHSIPGMTIDNVAIFDGNGLEVSQSSGNSSTQVGREGEEIAQMIEGQISAKITNVLGAVYGSGNVRIAVKAKVNMEKLLREVTTFNTPEKIGEDDKSGIVSEETWFSEYSGDGATASGVAGADSNADIPQYNTGAGNQADNAYGSTNRSRQYVINQIREQGQVDPGALEDLSISVVINGNDFGGLTLQQLENLIGNAAGMAVEDRGSKITVASVPFYSIKVPEPDVPVVAKPEIDRRTLMIIIAGCAAAFLVLLVLLIVLLRSGRKKKKAASASSPVVPKAKDTSGKKDNQTTEAGAEILNFDNDKGIELRKNVRDFAEQNPEISAQLLKTWLNGGDDQT